MESFDSVNFFSSACAPCSSDDSIFFNLILGTNYENTKENCLQFLRNFSKHIFFPKREIFKILINELTLNEYPNKVIGNDEFIYLIRQLIKKYSRNHIINALYDFISENDNNIGPENDINSTDSSMNRNQNCLPFEKELKISAKKFNPIYEKDNEGDNESNENMPKNNINFLSKKRKLLPLQKETIKEKKDKRKKKGKKSKKENKEKKEEKKDNIKEEKEDDINIKIENEDIEKDIKNDEDNYDGEGDGDEEMKEEDEKKMEYEEPKKEEEEINEKEKEKELEKEKEDIDVKKYQKSRKKDRRKIKKDKNQEDEEEMKQNEYEKENNKENKEENNKEEIKGHKEINEKEKIIKRDDDNLKEQIIERKKKYINIPRPLKTVPRDKSKSFTYFICKSDKKINQTKIRPKRFFSAEEIIKLESSDELILNNSMTISPIKTMKSINKIEKNPMDIFPFLNYEKSQNIPSLSRPNENEFRSHLIKYPKEKNIVYSYKLKKYQEVKDNVVLFECNNRKCKGKGEYDIDKNIFREIVGHNISAYSHKMASMYYITRDLLLKDNDCNGYQLLKDNTFIKDRKVIFLK